MLESDIVLRCFVGFGDKEVVDTARVKIFRVPGNLTTQCDHVTSQAGCLLEILRTWMDLVFILINTRQWMIEQEELLPGWTLINAKRIAMQDCPVA